MTERLVVRLGPAVTGRAWSPARSWQENGLEAGHSQAGGSGGTARTLCLLEGRITNLAELRSQTSDAGDAERVIALEHERWGEDVVARCAGEFTLFLWDRERGMGLVARDPLGHGALFHRHRDGTTVMASEVATLLDALPARPGPDRVSVAHWLAGTGVPEGRTLYEGVERLPGGHLLRLGDGHRTAHRFWRPRAGEPDVHSAGEAADLLRDAIASSVARSLQGTERPGVMLSGGLDSGTVAALAPGHDLVAYSGVFPEHPEVDESANVRAVRERLGLAGVERSFTGGCALAAAVEFAVAHRLPTASPNGYVWRPLARRAAADGVDVILDGEGGDELFGCVPFLIADALRAGRPARAIGLARRLPGLGGHPETRLIMRALRLYGLRAALPPGFHSRLQRARRSERPGEQWLTEDLARIHRETHDQWAWKSAPGPRWRAALLHTLVNRTEALGAADHFRREGALSGIAFRHPLRDPVLLDTVLRIDPALAFEPGQDRPVARAAMSGLLPDSVRLGARKPQFNVLLQQALTGPDAAAVRGLLDPAAAQTRAYLPQGVVDGWLAAGAQSIGPADLLALWRTLALECWLRLEAGEELPRELESGSEPDPNFRAFSAR